MAPGIRHQRPPWGKFGWARVADDIHIAAALILDPAGRTLLVRKHGTVAFQQPGGKLELGETAAQAVIRELAEEIGLFADPASLLPMGRFSAPAANEPGQRVVADVFVLRLDSGADITPAAEIAEARWIDPAAPGAICLAPLTGDEILPRIGALENPGPA